MIRTRTRTTFLRRSRPRRGTPRLLADLAVVRRLQELPARPARERLAATLGSTFAVELERTLALDGRPASQHRRRDRTRRAA